MNHRVIKIAYRRVGIQTADGHRGRDPSLSSCARSVDRCTDGRAANVSRLPGLVSKTGLIFQHRRRRTVDRHRRHSLSRHERACGYTDPLPVPSRGCRRRVRGRVGSGREKRVRAVRVRFSLGTCSRPPLVYLRRISHLVDKSILINCY